MRVLVLGAGGMLGHVLLQNLSTTFEVFGTLRGEVPEMLKGFDCITGVEVENLDAVSEAINSTRPHAVLNCIGVIKQLEPGRLELAQVNALFPHQLLKLCVSKDICLIHFSTDCVFSGREGFYSEASPPDPADDYGYSKLLGEIAEGGLTIRTSLIGREMSSRRGLVEWLYSQKAGRVKGFRNAVFSGLTTIEVARLVSVILRKCPDLEGVWHVGSDPISKYDLLNAINVEADLQIEIEPEETFCCDRSLDSSRFRKMIPYTPPEWNDMIRELVKEGRRYDS